MFQTNKEMIFIKPFFYLIFTTKKIHQKVTHRFDKLNLESENCSKKKLYQNFVGIQKFMAKLVFE